MYLDNIVNSNGLYITVGRQGSGKTALITMIAVKTHLENPSRIILSNYDLKIPHLKINMNSIVELVRSVELVDLVELVRINSDGTEETYIYDLASEYEKLTGNYPKSNNDYLNNSLILIDEIHVYFDSYDYLKEENRIISSFTSQLRKRNVLMLASTQYLLSVSIRIRKQATFVIDMLKNGTFFECDINEIDGNYNYFLTTEIADIRPYFKYYNTNEIIRP